MKQLFMCDKCGKTFYDNNDCKDHEKNCQKLFPIKGILIGKDINEKTKIKIVEYPKAILISDKKINLLPNSRYVEPIEIKNLHLDDIYENEDCYGIYTANFDMEYEKECLNKLISYRKESLKTDFINRIQKLEKNLKDIEKEKFEIILNKYYNLIDSNLIE